MTNPVTRCELGGRAALVLLAAALLGGCAPALNWREVRPEQADSLLAMFPCKPDHQSRELRLPDLPGGPVRLHVLTCEADGARWALSYLDAGSVERRQKALGLLGRALSNNLAMGGPRVTPQDLGPTTVPGMTEHPDARTWWLTGRRPLPDGGTEPVQVQAWHFSHGLTVFQASVWQSTLRPDDPRLSSFASGFNFLH
jgi:hypothetical protein